MEYILFYLLQQALCILGHYSLGRCEKWKFGKKYCPQMKLSACHINKIVLEKEFFSKIQNNHGLWLLSEASWYNGINAKNYNLIRVTVTEYFSKTILFLWQALNFIWGQYNFPNFHFSHRPTGEVGMVSQVSPGFEFRSLP